MKKTLICSFLIIILFLSACAAPETVERTKSTVTVEPTQKTSSPVKQPTKTMTQEVEDLLEMYKDIKSQQYTRDNGFDTTHVSIKGDKYKIDLTIVQKSKHRDLPGDIDTIYFDKSEKTAYGYCTDERTFACPAENRDKAYNLDYNAVKEEIFPLNLIKNIDYAEKTGSATIDGRKNTILEWNNQDGNRERVWIDNYFGFVMKQEIYDDNDEVLEKHTFTAPSINKLKDQDVNLPEGVEIVE